MTVHSHRFETTFFFQKLKKKSDKKNCDIFQISAQIIDCGYSLEPPRQVILTRTHNLRFEQKTKNNVYYRKPKFNYIKVGFFRGVRIIKVCFRDGKFYDVVMFADILY